MDFIGFVTGDVPFSFEFVREVFDRAVEIAGRHFMLADNIWEEYWEFELSKDFMGVRRIKLFFLVIFNTMKENGMEGEAVDQQEERVRVIFKRWLSCPLHMIDETWKDYLIFEKKMNGKVGDDENFPLYPNYTRSKKIAEICEKHEKGIGSEKDYSIPHHSSFPHFF